VILPPLVFPGPSVCPSLCLSFTSVYPVHFSPSLSYVFSLLSLAYLSSADSYGHKITLYVGLSLNLPVCLSSVVCRLSVCLSACIYFCLSVFMTASLPAYLPIHLSVSLCVCLYACLPVCLPACMSVSLTDGHSICYFGPSFHQSVCPQIHLSDLPACLPAHPSVCLPLCLPA
jgi:hypothetical protein